MKAQERDDLLKEMRQALLGIPDTEEKGMSGDVADIKDHLKELNKSVTKNTTFRKIVMYIGAPLLLALILGLVGVY